ncbi:MAG: urease accessory protein UreH [Acidobacteriota bacterium]
MGEMPVSAVLVLGFVLGLRHALDADHVAAMAATIDGDGGLRRSAAAGMSWGLGHALTIAAAGGLMLVLRVNLPERVALLLELAVGLMLTGLGLAALAGALRGRLHSHRHRHDGIIHEHLHFHRVPHPPEALGHRHVHPFRLSVRPFLIGTLHGLAGSGATALLVLTTLPSVALGLLYLGVFGVGSAAGMILMSVALAAPLALARSRAARIHGALRAAAGAVSLGVGLLLVWETGVEGGLLPWLPLPVSGGAG